MKRRGFGRIVNISSIGGKIAVPHLLSYTTSKFALAGFSQGLRLELAKHGIRVTTVYPSLMRTGSPRNAEFKGKHAAEYAWFILADSLPGISISATRVAKTIIRACVTGREEIVVGLPAKLVLAAHRVAPGIVNKLMSTGNEWLLPSASETENGVKKGSENETLLTRNPLTSLTRAAERANNQV
jgi:short-subunit dehydrogenase